MQCNVDLWAKIRLVGSNPPGLTMHFANKEPGSKYFLIEKKNGGRFEH